jgi:hypothetical protein
LGFCGAIGVSAPIPAAAEQSRFLDVRDSKQNRQDYTAR